MTSMKHILDKVNASRAYWIVATLSIVLRLVAIAASWRLAFTPDAQDYLAMARLLAAGERFVPYWPPGLPLYLLPFVKAGASDGVLRLAMLAFWIVLVMAFYVAVKQLLAERIGWVLLLVFSLTPAAIQLSITPLTQMPVAALMLVALVALLACLRGGGPGAWLGAGTAIAATTLVRPSAAVLLVLFLVPAVKRRLWLEPVLGCVIAFAILGGWLVKAHQMAGAWVFNTANTRNLWYGNNPDTPMYKTWYFGSHAKLGSDEIEQFPAYKATLAGVSALPPLVQQERFQHLAKQYILEAPGAFLLRSMNRARCFWGFDTFTALTLRKMRPKMFGPVLLLEALLYCGMAIWTLVRLCRAAKDFWASCETLLLLGSAVLYAAPYWISMSHPTYHFPVVVPLLLAGSWGWSKQGSPQSSKVAIALVVLLFLLVQLEWVGRMAGAS